MPPMSTTTPEKAPAVTQSHAEVHYNPDDADTQTATQKAADGKLPSAQDVKSQVASQAHEVTDAAKAKFNEASQQIRDQAQGALGQVKQTGLQYADKKRQKLVGEVNVVSQKIHHVADTLRNENYEGPAQYVTAAATQIDRVADAIATKPYAEMLDDVQHFARTRPELFYGGLFTAGLMAMRFLKATATPAQPTAAQGFSAAGDVHDSRYQNPAYRPIQPSVRFGETPPGVGLQPKLVPEVKDTRSTLERSEDYASTGRIDPADSGLHKPR